MNALAVSQLRVRAGSFCLGPVDLEADAGDYLVIMGATGSGKSLLLKAVCGLVTPSAGRIRLGDREVTRRPPRERGVGYVPQNSGLFPHLSVAENLAFAARVRGVSLKAGLAEAAELIQVLRLEPLLRRRPATLSGGERQKVALARALAPRPRMLVLDEPVSALDEPSRREVCAALRDVHRRFGVTTLHVCHSLEEARALATHLAVMADGRIVGRGPAAALLEQPSDHPDIRRLLGQPAGPGATTQP